MSDALKKLLLALGAQLPVAGAAWMGWSDVQSHPVAAALITVIWELLVLAGAFFSDVWSELRQDALKATVDWVRAGVRGFAPGFRRSYNQWLVREYGLFNVRGLGLINTFTLSLEQVFVELRINPANPQKLNLDPLKDREVEGNRPLWDLLRTAISSGGEAPAVLAIIGPPGCGKTTLLQHVAVTLAVNRQSRFRLRAYTPVLLFLRDHIAAISRENPPSLSELAQAHFSNKKVCGKAPPDLWFEKQLRAGRCMVLLDGLDEVAKLDQRQAVSRWVDAQVGNYLECPFVLTSRPQGYKDAPLARADVLEVQPLNAKQVIQFIERWYLANEIKSSGNQLNPDVRYRASRDAHDLMQRLQRTPSVNALTVNPLLLTMVAMVHRYHGALPGSRIELYKEICEVLLGRWRQAKGVQDDLKAAQKLVVLQTLAAHMMENERRDIGTEEAMQVIATPLERIGMTGAGRGEFLEKLRESSGLVQEREAGKWSFAHQTFQEYLAAAQWLEQKEVRRDWRQLAARSWWREMLRLYASQGDATELVKACLEVGTVDALMLAADCLEEAREIAPEVRSAAEERVIAGLDAPDPGHQHLAAEVKLARRLKSLQPIDDAQAIDLKHLTCAEYQLFLDDMRAAGKHHQPDHWLGPRFPKGQGHEPVCGVRAADAAEFCKWLTRRSGGSVRYRLPRPEEAREHPGEASRLGTWCHDGTRPVIECADGARQAEVAQVMGWQSLHEFARDRDLAFTLTHNLVRALDVVLDRTLTLPLALNRDLDLAHDLALTRDLVVARARALDDALALFRVFDLTLDQDLQRARALARSSNEFVAFHPEIQMEYLSLLSRIRETAPKVLEMSGGTHSTAWLARLMDALLGVAAAQTVLTMREAQRVLLDRVLEYGLTATTEPLPLLQRTRLWFDKVWFVRRSAVTSKMDLQALKNGLGLMLAREEGELTAWEGIRLVRENVQEQAPRTPVGGPDVTPYAHAA